MRKIYISLTSFLLVICGCSEHKLIDEPPISSIIFLSEKNEKTIPISIEDDYNYLITLKFYYKNENELGKLRDTIDQIAIETKNEYQNNKSTFLAHLEITSERDHSKILDENVSINSISEHGSGYYIVKLKYIFLQKGKYKLKFKNLNSINYFSEYTSEIFIVKNTIK